MEKIDARDILTKYLEGKSTAEEKALLESWHLNYALDGAEDLSAEEQKKDLDKVWTLLQQPVPVVKRTRLWPRLAIAAAVIFVGGIGLFFYQQKKAAEREQFKLAASLLPGKNDAVLTLSNGKKVILNETAAGEIAQESGLSITKAADGTIVYNNSLSPEMMKAKDSKLQYNTIATPRGGKYQINLPDGTKVWLNSASELKYPVIFASNERRVELKGEAYFEVSKNKTSPFHVKTINQDLEVLGTHFNINAFADEQETKTTLLEGSVKIVPVNSNRSSKIPGSVLLKPGQQVVLDKDELNVKKADISEVMSWKNGVFQFNDTELSSIMRQASRWYDVDVVYENQIPLITFTGEVSRNVNAATFLDMLKYLDVKFKIESLEGNRRRIIVSK
uniref:FecR family protein n=1 Tax=Pedobacter schmidteae TaxID=2201271 RepID=UPI000EABCBED|nr:FecR family protein [Pedobacter schmidteae]